jgi:hypothetical protein
MSPEEMKGQRWFVLRPHPDETVLRPLARPYLRSASDIKVHHLKKFLGKKFGESAESIDILLSDSIVLMRRLGNSISLADVYKFLWSHEADLVLHYRMEDAWVREGRAELRAQARRQQREEQTAQLPGQQKVASA